jgi:hypothetical protein
MNTPVECLFLQIGRKRYQVESLERASAMYGEARGGPSAAR